MEFINIKKGVALYKQKQSKNYYIYIRYRDEDDKAQEFRKSSRTDDYDLAVEQAMGYWFALKKNINVDEFKPKPKHTLSSITEEIAKELDTQAEKSELRTPQQKTHAAIMRQFLPYFSSLGCSDLDTSLMKSILSDLATNATKLRNVKKCFKIIFETLEEKKLVKVRDIPDIPSFTLSDVAADKEEDRTPFKSEHLDLIFSSIDDYIELSTSRKSKLNRTILKYMMRFLMLTGVRPGSEVSSIKPAHVKLEKDYFTIQIVKDKNRKKRKPRTIPVEKVSVLLLEEMMRKCNMNFHLPRYRDNDVFPIDKSHFPKVFSAYMKYLGLDQCGYVLYCFRHTFITKSILDNKTLSDIATYCGTSISMIERYYSDVKAVSRAAEMITLKENKAYAKLNVIKGSS